MKSNDNLSVKELKKLLSKLDDSLEITFKLNGEEFYDIDINLAYDQVRKKTVLFFEPM